MHYKDVYIYVHLKNALFKNARKKCISNSTGEHFLSYFFKNPLPEDPVFCIGYELRFFNFFFKGCFLNFYPTKKGDLVPGKTGNKKNN